MPKLPLPFSDRTPEEWIAFLQEAKSADDRLRALQAISVRCNRDQIVASSQQAIRDPDPAVKALAAKLLGLNAETISADAQAQLTSLLTDDDPDVRFEAARTIVRRPSAAASQALPVLLAFLDEPETDSLMLAATLNTIAASELTTEFVHEQLQPRMNRFLEHDRGEVREATSLIYARWPEIAKTDPERLVASLDDVEPVVREKIAFTLGEIGVATETIQSALQTASEDEDTEVAQVATTALQRLRQK